MNTATIYNRDRNRELSERFGWLQVK